MKNVLLTSLFLLLMLVVQSSNASQNFDDRNLNQILGQINSFGQNNKRDFIESVSKNSDLSKEQIGVYMAKADTSPADITLAIGLGEIKKMKTRVVMRRYHSHKSMGWPMMGVMLGIDKKSGKFDRWKKSQAQMLTSLLLYRKEKQLKKQKHVKKNSLSKGEAPNEKLPKGGSDVKSAEKTIKSEKKLTNGEKNVTGPVIKNATHGPGKKLSDSDEDKKKMLEYLKANPLNKVSKEKSKP